MALGLVFIGIGLVWLLFRRPIARRQHWITSQMIGRRGELSESEPPHEADTEAGEERVRGFEMLGVFFCAVMIVGGLLIVVLTLILRSPWAGE
ncbi:hypothetical protein HP499_21850 [Paenarthrobacter sp. CM16]|uniref:hypothetical protein n=1 Tax=Paenarthrobacter sp. CM16 TaxID=2738447 RepID=UPI0015572D93|nr:hypothetical protein [Paenarthrobacter sp. CM16]NQD90431.1 hypothetical protein [Paenarthrobacter sp. CM16]